VCTDIIHLENHKLKYYKGGYYLFKKQYEKDMISNQKLYEETEKRINSYKKSGKTKNEIEAFIKLNPLPGSKKYIKLYQKLCF
jgi:ATPase subunit of ABC transporter with duplicated ATPase domains